MWSDKYTYLVLMIGSFIFPFIFSFEKQIRFYRFYKALGLAILISGTVFIVWDVLFTKLGFWSFNDNFILGPRLLGLPIEEWMFFIVIPYCSIFIYEVLKLYLPDINFNSLITKFILLLVVLFSLFAIINIGKWYSFINMLANVILLLFILTKKNFRQHLTHFFLAFIIACVPMLLVNGVLTAMPVVEYNAMHFSNIRLFSIPIEDFSYFLLLMLLNVWVFEKIKYSKL